MNRTRASGFKTSSAFALMILAAFLSFAETLPARDLHGSAQPGEGGEVVVAEGIILREVAPSESGKLPLVAVGTAGGVHHLYDPNQGTMQGFWTGLFGRLDEGGTFVPALENLRSFSLDRTPPWSFGEKPRRALPPVWRGVEVRDGAAIFRYALEDQVSGMSWEIEERLEHVSEQLQRLHFDIAPSGPSPLYLNYWVTQTNFRRLSTNGQQGQRNKLKNLHPNQEHFTITFLRRKESPTIPHGYSVETIEIPSPAPPFLFEPTDLDFAPDGSVYASTRTGGVWRRLDGAWSLFADGLHEVNGIRVAPGGEGVYVMQKPELTLLRDTDDDGVADLYETVEDRFRFTGQYHEFAYGPRINTKGEMFFSTGLASSGYHTWNGETQNQMTSALGYRGWVMRRNPDGSLTPFAAGLRSPAGIGMNAEDELFITDNQGDWVANSYLGHVEEGDFLGHPAALWDRPEYALTPRELDYTNNAAIPEKVPLLDKGVFSRYRKRPAVWLSHGDLTNSPGHPSFAPKSGFGPFSGQAFIADIAHRNIIRVALEKVGGSYQGAVFPFLRPLSSAAYSTAFDPEGNLWVGAVGRGWVAGDPAIEIIRFDPDKTPFEMHRIELTRTGFDIHFTEPLGPDAIADHDVSISGYQLEYRETYGSERINEAEAPIAAIDLSADRSVLSIEVPLKAEHLYEIQLPELKSASGLPLENNYGIYTLNRLLP